MVQIGTNEYDSDKWCHPTTVSLIGGSNDMAKLIPEDN